MSENDDDMNAIDDEIKKEPMFAGIDEAGRGPVIGPMVYACAFAPLSKKEDLAKIGFKDSKQLKEAERESLFEIINKSSWIGYKCDMSQPQTISSKMLRKRKVSLNVIANESAAGIVRSILRSGVVIAELYVDTVGSPEKYKEYLARNFPQIKSIDVRSKADSIFPIVSAASICAKVTRDHALREWNYSEKEVKLPHDTGSGYPGDPQTLKFLDKNFDPFFILPSITRFSWKTVDNFSKKKKAIEMKWEGEDEEFEGVKIDSFFAKVNKPLYSGFFLENKLESV